VQLARQDPLAPLVKGVNRAIKVFKALQAALGQQVLQVKLGQQGLLGPLQLSLGLLGRLVRLGQRVRLQQLRVRLVLPAQQELHQR